MAVALGGLALTGVVPTATASDVPTSDAQAVVIYQVEQNGVDPVDLAERLMAAGFDVSGRTTSGLYVTGSAATMAELQAVAGVTVVGYDVINSTVDASVGGGQDDILPKKLDGRTYASYYGGYRTVEGHHEFLADLGEEYPTFAKVVDYGDSYLGDYPLRAVCITANADKGCKLQPDVAKARFLFATQIHARELTTGEISWRYITYLLDGYKTDAQVRALLNSTEVWVVTQVNPDGIHLVNDGITEEGLGSLSPAWQRKNVNPGTIECTGPWSSSHEGVDLNRNWGYHWGEAGTDPNQCGQTWPGVEADSEPETYLLQDLMKDLFRDQRGTGEGALAPQDTTGAALTLHSAANLALFPWGYDADVQAPNDEGLRSYAFRASYYNEYPTGQPGEILYDASGNTDDWGYATLGIATGTWETGPGAGTCAGFHPAYTCQDAFFELNLPALMYQAVAARAPYQYALGPTTTKAKAKLKSAGKYEVTINASDAALGPNGPNPPDFQDVTAARIFVGKAPWESGATSKPMSITGSGDTVTAKATINAGSKKAIAYTQAKDADGNWGPVRAVWIPKA